MIWVKSWTERKSVLWWLSCITNMIFRISLEKCLSPCLEPSFSKLFLYKRERLGRGGAEGGLSIWNCTRGRVEEAADEKTKKKSRPPVRDINSEMTFSCSPKDKPKGTRARFSFDGLIFVPPSLTWAASLGCHFDFSFLFFFLFLNTYYLINFFQFSHSTYTY